MCCRNQNISGRIEDEKKGKGIERWVWHILCSSTEGGTWSPELGLITCHSILQALFSHPISRILFLILLCSLIDAWRCEQRCDSLYGLKPKVNGGDRRKPNLKKNSRGCAVCQTCDKSLTKCSCVWQEVFTHTSYTLITDAQMYLVSFGDSSALWYIAQWKWSWNLFCWMPIRLSCFEGFHIEVGDTVMFFRLKHIWFCLKLPSILSLPERRDSEANTRRGM